MRALRLSPLLLAAVLAACSGSAPAVRPGGATGPGAAFGVELGLPRRLAAGYLVEVEVRVVDAALAAPLFAAGAAARLVVDARGKVLSPAAPWGGQPEAGRSYPVRFDNTANAVAAGDRATLFLGPLEARDLQVAE